MSEHLNIDEFLSEVSKLFKTANTLKRNVRLTMKRLVVKDEVTKPLEFDSTRNSKYDVSKMSNTIKTVKSGTVSKSTYKILIRATMGAGKTSDSYGDNKKIKVSTIVDPNDLDLFWRRYSSCIKSGMVGLSKRKKKKSKSHKNEKTTNKKTKIAKKN
ncbi:RNA-binding signal recognition particle subunit SRP14 SCDLUD_002672 [Saccharomycodes ludwigii]|uniref:RNA-binding signal recognition particle subunit SRP14 n=1 Tax=Saccharomycodes ludwigii TaxID=36035 RepID=UPI001E825B8A|nr:hypothetical protein SCDLUD_002672 [Saccharomycodes ludwigii]KAH3901186.1 hypothetical protein SCDLUD_002672 [Saccharomycodes ludwigii]